MLGCGDHQAFSPIFWNITIYPWQPTLLFWVLSLADIVFSLLPPPRRPSLVSCLVAIFSPLRMLSLPSFLPPPPTTPNTPEITSPAKILFLTEWPPSEPPTPYCHRDYRAYIYEFLSPTTKDSLGDFMWLYKARPKSKLKSNLKVKVDTSANRPKSPNKNHCALL